MLIIQCKRRNRKDIFAQHIFPISFNNFQYLSKSNNIFTIPFFALYYEHKIIFHVFTLHESVEFMPG